MIFPRICTVLPGIMILPRLRVMMGTPPTESCGFSPLGRSPAVQPCRGHAGEGEQVLVTLLLGPLRPGEAKPPLNHHAGGS